MRDGMMISRHPKSLPIGARCGKCDVAFMQDVIYPFPCPVPVPVLQSMLIKLPVPVFSIRILLLTSPFTNSEQAPIPAGIRISSGVSVDLGHLSVLSVGLVITRSDGPKGVLRVGTKPRERVISDRVA